MSNGRSPRVEEARRVAVSLLDDLEGAKARVDAILMKAKRLARMMRDQDAQTWLDLETRGYPSGFSFESLGTCREYAVAGGRLNLETSKYWPQSLPELEANAASEEAHLNALRSAPTTPSTAKDFLEKNATEALLATQLKLQVAQKKNYAQSQSLLASMKAGIHSYATDTYLALELGDVAEDIFEKARMAVDRFVRAYCPTAAEKLVAINERMSESSSESWTAALTSCRRLLMSVADAVFPAREEEWKDAAGKARKVGVEQYKNRLLAYLTESGKGGSRELVASELEHLAGRLDAIYEKTCKGVHVNVSEQEATLAVIHTYLFIGEIASTAELNVDREVK
jgi:AbiTii-like protein